MAVTNGISQDLLLVKVDPYAGRRNAAIYSKKVDELEAENKALKDKLKAAGVGNGGYGSRGQPGKGRGRGRGGYGSGSSGHSGSSGQGGSGNQDLSNLTKSKLQETCSKYNGGENDYHATFCFISSIHNLNYLVI